MISRIPKSLLAIGAVALMVLGQSSLAGSVAAAAPTGAGLAIAAPTPSHLIATKTTLSSRTNPSVFGTKAPLMVQVKPASRKGKTTPTGTLAVKVDGKLLSAPLSLKAGSSATASADWSINCVITINPFSINCTLNLGSAYLASLAPGNHTVQVFYSGDATYAASHSSILKQRIVRVATTTDLTSTANPTVLGKIWSLKSVTKIANDRTKKIAPTGTLALLVDGKALDAPLSIMSTPVAGGSGSAASAANWSINCTITFNPFSINCTLHLASAYLASLAPGDHTFQVVYSGDTHYGKSSSKVLTEKITSG